MSQNQAMSDNNNKRAVGFLRPVGWYPAIGLIVALLPESIVSKSLLGTQFLEVAKEWIPAIGSMGAVSSFPTITGLYMTVMWVLFPFAFLKLWPQLSSYPPQQVEVKTLIKQALAAAAIIVMMVSFLYWFPFSVEDEDISLLMGRWGGFLYLTTQSQLGFGMVIGCSFWTLAVTASLFFLQIKHIANRST